MDTQPNTYINTRHSREKLEQGGKLHGMHWLVIVASLVLTFGAWYISSTQVDGKNKEKFDREVGQVLELIQERMNLYENALSGGVAYIDVNGGHVTYSQWLKYAASLHIEKKYPGINGIGVIFNIQPADLPAFLEEQRRDRPNFGLHPGHNEAEYWPITYIEPVEQNMRAVGLDMAFETNRYTAVKNARDTGFPQVTGPITLVQDAQKTPGFLLYTPFYKTLETPETLEGRRKNIVGVTYAPFIMKQLMQGMLASQKRQVSITITDGSDELFDDSTDGKDPKPLFKSVNNLDIYGRTWTLDFQSSLNFRNATANYQPYWILAGGLMIDVLLVGLFVLLTRANRNALMYADQMTKALEDKTARLEKSNEDLEHLSYVASHDLRAPLNAIKQVASWIEEDCADILPEASRSHLELLKRRSERMTRLLQDLRSYSKVNQYTDHRETLNLADTTAEISFLIGKEKKVKCYAPDITIEIQRIPFEIVLRNLIANAIKHHDKKTGELHIEYTAKDGNHIFRIEDDGPGIPDDMHKKVMEMYQTLKPRDQKEGSGMGLAIIKKIIDHYNGSVVLEIGRTRGTCFIITWPLV